MFDLSKEEVDISCPKCKSVSKVSLAQIGRQEKITCGKCGVQNHLKDKDGSTKKAIQDANRALDDLQRTIKSFK